MTQISYPHSGHNSGAVTESEYAQTIGWESTSGLIGLPTDTSPLYISGSSLLLRADTEARVLGMAYQNATTDLNIPIAANSGLGARPDHVVLRLTWSTMEVRAAVRQGTAGGTLPTLVRQRGSGVYEISLGQVVIPGGGGTVATSTLTRLGWYIGPDGLILCNSTTRPPSDGGRRIWEMNTGRELLSTGSTWVRTYDDSGDVALTASSGFNLSPSGALGLTRIRRINGIAYIRMDFERNSSTTITANSPIAVATAPDGYRPAGVLWVDGEAGQQHARYRVDVNGLITLYKHPGLSNGAACAMSGSWPVA